MSLWEKITVERDAEGKLTLLALAMDAVRDNGCDCGDGPDEPPCMACLCEAALRQQWDGLQRLEREVAWQKTLNEGKDKAQRMLRRLAERYASHDWQEAEPSPSGKVGVRCSLCGKYSNAPVLACLDPCIERGRLWEEAQTEDCDDGQCEDCPDVGSCDSEAVPPCMEGVGVDDELGFEEGMHCHPSWEDRGDLRCSRPLGRLDSPQTHRDRSRAGDDLLQPQDHMAG